MSKFTVEIAGTKYPWTEIAYVREFRFYGKPIEVWIPEWVAGISGDDAIVIKRDGAKVTEGKIKKIEPHETIVSGIGMKVTGYTNELDSEKLLAAARTYNVDPQTIITNNLNANLSAGTINAYGSSIAMEFGSSENAKFNRKQVYEETCFVTGWETYVSPASAVDFKSACGVDRSSTVKFKHGELLHLWGIPHQVNVRDKITKVIVLGALEGDYLAYGISGSGDAVMTVERKNLIDDNTCTLAAAAMKADAENDVICGSFYAINTYSGAAFDVYDTVRIEDARFGVAGNYRIYRIEVRIFAGGEETKIYYTNITHLTANAERLLNSTAWMLKAGQRILRDMGRASHNIINLDALDSSGNLNLAAEAGWVNKNLDEVADGSTYERVKGTALTSGDVDLDKSGVVGTLAASKLDDAMQPFMHNLDFQPGNNSEENKHNAVHWAAGTIKFSDGGTQNISAGEITSLGDGVTRYIYFIVGNSTLQNTSEYSSVASATTRLLATVSVSTDTDQEIAILTSLNTGGNFMGDLIPPNAISESNVKNFAIGVKKTNLSMHQIY